MLFALDGHIACLIPLLFLSVTILKRRYALRLFLALLLGLVSCAYVSSHVQYPPSYADGKRGKAFCKITNIVPSFRYGKPFLKLELAISSFEADDHSFTASHFPATWYCHDIARRPSADFWYSVEGVLREKEGGWSFKPLPQAAWLEEGASYSLAEWRFRAKASFKALLARFLPPNEARGFLEGVLMGEFHDRELASSLRRFGLQHILAVSGFHFSLLATIVAMLLRLVLSWKATIYVLIASMTFYLLFVGLSPSVLRAWCSISLVLIAKLYSAKSNGLNALGIGLLFVLIVEPTWATSLSFQLSFLATLAILLFYPLALRGMRLLFPPHSGSDVFRFSFSDQLVIVLISFLTASLALVLSVSLFMLPMSLFAFQSFPLMGILYNCFFPFFISCSVFVVCIASLFSWCPPIASLLFTIAQFVTETSLTLVTHAPSWLDITICRGTLSSSSLVFYLCLLFFVGMLFSKCEENASFI